MPESRPPGATLISILMGFYAAWSFIAPLTLVVVVSESMPAFKMIPGLTIAGLSLVIAIGAWKLAPWTPTCFAAWTIVLVLGGWLSIFFFDPSERGEMIYPFAIGSAAICAVSFFAYRYLRAVTRPAV